MSQSITSNPNAYVLSEEVRSCSSNDFSYMDLTYFRNYYFYEFGNNIQHVALLAAVNSGKVHISTLFVDFEYIYCSANMLLDVILVEHVRVERGRIKLQFK